MSEDRDERIRRRAYELWESEERPHGEDIRHWMQARKEFETRQPNADVSVGTPEASGTPEVEITTGERAAGETIRETEGP